ncbi:hypothetical protein AB0B01_06150 [Streptomyces sp. NPDC044571]|uniref:hypothetical protein n=1 Tax=Streptomyces sp. NPDC044571 TaxID=3155371 RepID=UPI0033FA3598
MFAAVCVLLASLGHIAMSGMSVPWWAMAVAFPCAGAAAWSLAGRERGLLAVTAAAVTVQAALHAAFSLVQSLAHPALPDGTASQPPPGTTATTALADTAVHAHHGMHDMTGMHGMTDGSAGTAGAVLPSGHEMSGMSPSGMLAAHLLAAVLAGLWLAYGEQTAFRLLRVLAAWFCTPLRLLFAPAPVPHRPPGPVRRARRSHPLRQLLLVHAITSRGPPAVTAVL